MPSSYLENISFITQTIKDLKPNSILDIGPGRGKYGLLSKEYLPDTKVDALEIFPDYVTPTLKSIYDKVIIGNALTEKIGKYDLYLIIDVLEHWDIEEALPLLRNLTKQGNVLISTPRAPGEQDAVFGNEWERHISKWNGFNFDEFESEDLSNGISFIYLLKCN